MHTDIAVMGGGMAGLAAATYCARAGKRVVVLERGGALGGRSATRLHEGFSFNQGLRALYLGGAAERVLRELGVVPVGRVAPKSGTLLWSKGELSALPVGFVTLATTGALSARSKLVAARVLLELDRAPLASFAEGSLDAYIDAVTEDAAVRALLRASFRTATYTKNLALVGTRRAVMQLRRVAHAGVFYLDGGWGALVEALRERAVAAGVTIRAGAVVGHVDDDGVRLESGEVIAHRACILAVPPRVAASVAAIATRETEPILASCLDVAVSALPEPGRRVVIGLEAPFFFNVQSMVAKTAPPGAALMSVIEYLAPGARGERATLEKILDVMQYGWRERVVHAQFLPKMMVAADHAPGPGVATALPHVFGAGDGWGEAMLLDGALESACEAATLAIGAADDRRIEARVA